MNNLHRYQIYFVIFISHKYILVTLHQHGVKGMGRWKLSILHKIRKILCSLNYVFLTIFVVFQEDKYLIPHHSSMNVIYCFLKHYLQTVREIINLRKIIVHLRHNDHIYSVVKKKCNCFLLVYDKNLFW